LLFLAAAPLALARQNPEPPPSGEVVHLFGPDSVISHVLPTTPGTGTTATPAGAQPSTYDEPAMGDILHQMFVTGDPNAPSLPSAGRNLERP
jgi:hypothetical protein